MSEGKYLKDAALLNKASHILALGADGSVGRIAPSVSNGLSARKHASPGSANVVKKEWTRVAKITSNRNPSVCEICVMSAWGAVGPRFLRLSVCASVASWNKENNFWESGAARCLVNSSPTQFTKIRLVHENPGTTDNAVYLEVNNTTGYMELSKLHVSVDRIFGNAEAIAQPCEGNVPDGAWVKVINLADITLAIGGGKWLTHNLLQSIERRWCA